MNLFNIYSCFDNYIHLPYQSSAGWYDTLKPCILPLRPVGRGKSHDTWMLCDVKDLHVSFSGGIVGTNWILCRYY